MKQLSKLTTILMMLMLTFSFTACGDDDDDDPQPTPVQTTLTINNKSTYNLDQFRIIFINDSYEKVSDRNYGTFYSGKSITGVEIPNGATQYYFATTSGGTTFFSVNYKVTLLTVNLTTDVVGEWTSNS